MNTELPPPITVIPKVGGLIYKKIPLIMGEVGAIGKTRQGTGINYAFRGIDDLTFALQPLLTKHGVFPTPKVISIAREERTTKSGTVMTISVINMEFTFFAEDGSSVCATTVGEAMDTSDKSCNKAMSAAFKYALLQVFCIPTEEEKDTEYQNHEMPNRNKEPAQKPMAPVSDISAGSILIPFGKFKDKRLKDIPQKDLISWVTYMREQPQLNDTAKDIVKAAEFFLAGKK